MTLLNEFADALKAVEDNVYYGTGVQHDKSKPWNYIVFSRDVLRRKQNRSGYADVVNVAIVREEYIPEGTEERVIAALEALAGVRLVEEDHEYFYNVKPNTSHVVEMCVLKFTHSRKS